MVVHNLSAVAICLAGVSALDARVLAMGKISSTPHALLANGQPAPSAPTTAVVWQPWEVVLTSSVAYTQPKPWWGTELNATFTHAASGTVLETPGLLTAL